MNNNQPELTPTELRIQRLQQQLNQRIKPTAALYMASKQVRSALYAQMRSPSDKFVSLSAHPCFCLLWTCSPSQLLAENLIMTELETFDTHHKWLELAQLLKQALPDLAANFETQQGLSQVWILACARLLILPLHADPLKNASTKQFDTLRFGNHQAQPAS